MECRRCRVWGCGKSKESTRPRARGLWQHGSRMDRETPHPLVEAHGLSLHFDLGPQRVDVLRGVGLAVAPGESVAIVGPSGSGKTSLLLLLAGLERPSAGTIRIEGRALDGLSRDQLADLRRDRMGIVFQSFHLLPSLSALDNVALPLQMAGREDAHARAREQLARVGLASRMEHRPAELSGGEQQRVAIARATVHRPRLLLADEPTGNLDDASAEGVRQLLLGLNREQGTALVLVTHDPAFAARCGRVLRLRDGRVDDLPLETADALPAEPGLA
jgi:putative ABC transport system ATP-binding protein